MQQIENTLQDGMKSYIIEYVLILIFILIVVKISCACQIFVLISRSCLECSTLTCLLPLGSALSAKIRTNKKRLILPFVGKPTVQCTGLETSFPHPYVWTPLMMVAGGVVCGFAPLFVNPRLLSFGVHRN